MTEGLRELGRFAEPSISILVSLADGPMDGKAIMSRVEAVSGRRLRAGTLYGSLARLERRGLIESLRSTGPLRPYRLTEPGASRVKSEPDRLLDVVGSGLTRIEGGAVPS